ncbi:MOSC domain-containing protein [Kitasatospora atroaurantiaca]|uniref:MOSC domain-containing protein n=1 Tax=Kitasatospora atroaurantiaca TaxID=285545 RepID=UPI001FE28A97|nr:MOSC N-terminal beta barrel domain-containing protein [Kitasatospora atroaurantiaca]
MGRVEGLWRYPVKSMLGEELAEAEVGGRGVDGDRGLALLDVATGQVASAKNPRLWRQLLTFTARATDEGVRITGPAGKGFLSTDPAADGLLSGLLGRRVSLRDTPPPRATLQRSVPEEVLRSGVEAEVGHTVSELGRAAPVGTFFDFAPLHLLSTATLDRIAELSPRGSAEAARYRPNLVIRTDGPPFAENDWAGRELLVGDGLHLKVLVPTPRCAVPTLAHGELPRDADALRVLARHNRVEPLPGLGLLPCAGAYAQVVHPGRVRAGDVVRPA